MNKTLFSFALFHVSNSALFSNLFFYIDVVLTISTNWEETKKYKDLKRSIYFFFPRYSKKIDGLSVGGSNKNKMMWFPNLHMHINQ